MSIPLREGFVDETLERCLEDLIVRFVVNCPEEDLSSIERVLFQIEEAHWFYQDFLRTLNPLLPSMKMKQFTNKLIEQCPLIWKWGDPSEALAQFGKYKSTIPVRGCALLNSTMDKLLLVKGIESPSWGFPRGKISKGEKDIDCALRELEEETGFDASDLIDEDEFVERTIKGKNYKIFIIKGVPEDTIFIPKVRYEIVDIQWMDIKFLTKAVKTTSNYYLVGSMLKSILSYIKRVKNSESEDELKKLATVQLKKILGISGDDVKNKVQESDDPGRALLSMLQSVAKNAQIISTGADSITASSSTSTPSQPLSQPLPSGQQVPANIQIPQQPQQQFQPQQQAQHVQNPFFSMPMPPNILPMQQPKMVSLPFQNPFALQMFNPFAFSNNLQSMPYNPVSHLHLPQPLNNPMASQGMSFAPSASTFSKPQFSLSSKRADHANSKELLSILKSKPPQTERKNSNSAELLSVLKKDTTTNNSPQVPSSMIKVLKRETPSTNSLDVNLITERQPKQKKHTQVKKPQPVKIDITEPANDSTSRDISRPLSTGKPIVLLKKSNPNSPSLNQSLINKLPEKDTSSPIMNASIKSPQLEDARQAVVEKRQNSSNGKAPVSVDNLSLLTSPNEKNNWDPSSQLLDILHRKNTPTDPQSSDLPVLMGSDKSSQNSSETNTSKELLKILKSDTPSSVSQPFNITPINTNDKSKELLSLLKNHKSPSMTSPAASSSSPRTESTPALTESASSTLLNILKGPPISNKPVTNPPLDAPVLSNFHQTIQQPQPDQQTQSSQVNSNSAAILEMLKGPPKKNISVGQPLHADSTTDNLSSMFLNGFNNGNGQLKNELGNPASAQSVKVADETRKDDSNSPIADFEDFEDFDDGEIEGEYIMNGGLYDADE